MNVLKVNISPQVWLPFSLKFLPGEVQSSQEWQGLGQCGERGSYRDGLQAGSRASVYETWKEELGVCNAHEAASLRHCSCQHAEWM